METFCDDFLGKESAREGKSLLELRAFLGFLGLWTEIPL